MSTDLKKKIRSIFLAVFGSFEMLLKMKNRTWLEYDPETGRYVKFKGCDDNFVENGRLVLENNISLFHGRTNPIHHFTVYELNSMNLDRENRMILPSYSHNFVGAWMGRPVLVNVTYFPYSDNVIVDTVQDIVVSARMGTHTNITKLIGCCLETKYPILIHEWGQYKTLPSRLFVDEFSDELNWKDRLRIAWEISHVIAYLHTAFRRPIIYRDWNLDNIFLDQDNAVKMTDFCHSVAIPEGEIYVEGMVIGSMGYIAPEYWMDGRMSEKTDVFAFGKLFLVLLTRIRADFYVADETGDKNYKLLEDWVDEGLKNKCIHEIIDSAMLTDEGNGNEDNQQQVMMIMRASIELALKCTDRDEYTRPSMVEISTELKSIIKSSESICCSFTNMQACEF